MQGTLHFHMYFPKTFPCCRDKEIGFCNQANGILCLQGTALFKRFMLLKRSAMISTTIDPASTASPMDSPWLMPPFRQAMPVQPKMVKKAIRFLMVKNW